MIGSKFRPSDKVFCSFKYLRPLSQINSCHKHEVAQKTTTTEPVAKNRKKPPLWQSSSSIWARLAKAPPQVACPLTMAIYNTNVISNAVEGNRNMHTGRWWTSLQRVSSTQWFLYASTQSLHVLSTCRLIASQLSSSSGSQKLADMFSKYMTGQLIKLYEEAH